MSGGDQDYIICSSKNGLRTTTASGTTWTNQWELDYLQQLNDQFKMQSQQVYYPQDYQGNPYFASIKVFFSKSTRPSLSSF